MKREVERAVSKGKPIFSIRVSNVAPSRSLELFISSEQWIDAWEPPPERHFERLAETIKAAAEVQQASASPSKAPSPTTPTPTVDRTSKKRPKPWALVVGVVALVLIVGTFLSYRALRTQNRTPTLPQTAGQTQPPLVASRGDTPVSTPPKSSTPTQSATAPTLPPAQPAISPPASPSGSDLAQGPCPAGLYINPDLPTPFTCSCSAEAAGSGTVWGTDVYTDDSALCRAALHAGAIPAAGGTVTVLRTEGRPLYVGTTRNGVRSNDYGAHRASIRFK